LGKQTSANMHVPADKAAADFMGLDRWQVSIHHIRRGKKAFGAKPQSFTSHLRKRSRMIGGVRETALSHQVKSARHFVV